MDTVVVVGMGRVGQTIMDMLPAQCEGYGYDTLEEAQKNPSSPHPDVVFSCVPYTQVPAVARFAMSQMAHYIDFTEDNDTREWVKGLVGAYNHSVVMSGAGLAPGYVNQIAGRLVRSVPGRTIRSIRMYCGALPQDSAGFGYHVPFNTAGLINEYLKPVRVKVASQVSMVPSLTEYEKEIDLFGRKFEAFRTSGGAGTTPDTLPADSVEYLTLRYPGHHNRLKTMIEELKMFPEEIVAVFERQRADVPDLVAIAVNLALEDGSVLQHVEVVKGIDGMSACSYMTAKHGIEVMKAALVGRIPHYGWLRPEEF